MYHIPLHKSLFSSEKRVLLESQEFTVTAFNYPCDIASLVLKNSKGFLEILPFTGQIIWEAFFENQSLSMKSMFEIPKKGNEIIDAYGCFAFHSGLLAGGCPSPEDTHPLHGEFPCVDMDKAWLEVTENSVSIVSEYEYVKGFGNHYLARPVVRLYEKETCFDIDMSVTNLSKYQPMPLIYMCHLNYAYIPNGEMRQNIPDNAFQLRQSIPAHVTPTPEWQVFNENIQKGNININRLDKPEFYNPEIVYFIDNLIQYGEELEFELYNPSNNTRFVTNFSTLDFSNATRWILYNADQQVAAFILPATARPEGYCAAKSSGTLQWLNPRESKKFHVNTGIKK